MSVTIQQAASPSVVMVTGAFADRSSWNGAIERLQAKGVPVTAAVNPLRGVSHDSAHVASVLNEIPGRSLPSPLVRGCGDHERGEAGEERDSPGQGERLADAEGASMDSVLNSVLVPHYYPAVNGGEPGVEFAIDPAGFHDAFAADLPVEVTVLRSMAERGPERRSPADGSHVIMISQPQVVIDVIVDAIAATSRTRKQT